MVRRVRDSVVNDAGHLITCISVGYGRGMGAIGQEEWHLMSQNVKVERMDGDTELTGHEKS